MSRPIRLGNIALSFHAVSAAVVQRSLEACGATAFGIPARGDVPALRGGCGSQSCWGEPKGTRIADKAVIYYISICL